MHNQKTTPILKTTPIFISNCTLLAFSFPEFTNSALTQAWNLLHYSDTLAIMKYDTSLASWLCTRLCTRSLCLGIPKQVSELPYLDWKHNLCYAPLDVFIEELVLIWRHDHD